MKVLLLAALVAVSLAAKASLENSKNEREYLTPEQGDLYWNELQQGVNLGQGEPSWPKGFDPDRVPVDDDRPRDVGDWFIRFG